MGLYSAMRTSTSGMNAQSNRLSTVSDNIANTNTNGYKRVSAEFSSLVLKESMVATYTSGSVETAIRYSIDEQGTYQYSTSGTDLAIGGKGFFIVNDAAGGFYLSRAGSFVVDGNGDLLNAGGFYLMGYPIVAGQTTPPVVNGYAGLERVNVSDLSLRATPSTIGSFEANLPSDAAIIPAADLPSNNAASAVITEKSSLVAFDSLGGQAILDVYFSKTGASTWEMAVFDRNDRAANGSFPYNNPPLAVQTLDFDVTTGQLTALSATSISVPIPGGQTLDIDLSKMTQLSSPYTVLSSAVNGNAPIAVQSMEISKDGTVYASYPNGTRVPTFKIPLVTVQGPNFLQPLPGNVFRPTEKSGNIQVGFAETGSFGSILSNTTEQSNADLATELTIMIDAQKGYTANSKVFQTSADLVDVLMNLKR